MRPEPMSRIRLLTLVLAVPLGGLVLLQIHSPGSTDFFPTLMRRVSLGTAVLGLLLLGIIRLAGWAAARSRERLVLLFRPGLYVTVFSIATLVLVHAGIAVAIPLYYFFAISLLPVPLIAVIGSAAMIRGLFKLIQNQEIEVLGVNVDPNKAPRLWEHVHRIANRMGALRPKHITVGLGPGFFVTEATVKCLDSGITGRTLFCPLPLARILTVQQFSSAIAHELGHFKGADIAFGKKFYPIYHGTSAALQSVASSYGGGLITISPIGILIFFMETFAFAERRLARARELAADDEGAKVTDARTMAVALVKQCLFIPASISLYFRVIKGLRARSMFINLSRFLTEEMGNALTPERLEGVAETEVMHPVDSHPPLRARLEALGVTMEEVSEESLMIDVSDPAIGLIDDAESLERQITIAVQQRIAERLGIDMLSFPPVIPVGSNWAAKRRRARTKAKQRRR